MNCRDTVFLALHRHSTEISPSLIKSSKYIPVVKKKNRGKLINLSRILLFQLNLDFDFKMILLSTLSDLLDFLSFIYRVVFSVLIANIAH